MREVKEELKNIILMGLGAISMTGEKASALRQELLDKGQSLYKEGKIKNEELKRDIKDKIKENIKVEVKSTTKEDIFKAIKSMNSEEKQELEKLLRNNNTRGVNNKTKKTNKTKKD